MNIIEKTLLFLPLFLLVFSLDSMTPEAHFIKMPLFVISVLILIGYLLISKKRLYFNFNIVFFLFIVWMIISLFWSINYKISAVTIISWLSIFLYAGLLTANINTNSLGRQILFLLAIFLFIVSAIGILQYYGWDKILKFGVLQNWEGDVITVFGNPNFTADFLISIVPVVLCTALETKKVIYVISGLLGLFTIFLTRSRGAELGISISLLFLIFGYRKIINKRVLIGLIAGVILVFGFNFTNISSQIKETITDVEKGFRLLAYISTLELIKNNFNKGVGIDNFVVVYPLYDIHKKEGRYLELKTNEAHNDFLQVFAETGIIGISFFVTFLIFVFMKKGGYIYGIIALLIQSLFNFPLQIITTQTFFYLFSLMNFKKIRILEYNIISLFLSFILLIFLIIVYIKEEAGLVYYRLGTLYKEANMLEKSYESYSKALKLTPYNPDLLTNLSVVCTYLKKDEEIFDLVKDAIKYSPYEDATRLNLAVELYKKGLKGEAASKVKSAYRLSPKRKQVVEFLEYLKKQ
ncbi:MAG: O-antigen ligase family protein [Candidatus Hydrogenedentota bacterium]